MGRRWRRPLLGLLAVYPAILVVTGSRLGPGVTADSVVYVQAARSFVESGDFLAFGDPITLWPPGFPVLLAGLLRVGLPLEPSVVAVNALCAGVTVLLTFALARTTLRSDGLGLLIAALVAVSASTARVFVMLWSEPVFTALVLAGLLLLTRWADGATAARLPTLLVAILVSAACTIRFAGVALLPVVLVASLLGNRPRGWRRTVPVAIATTALASAGLVAVVVRNVLLGAGPLGDRSDSGFGLAKVVGTSLRQVGRIVLPDPEWPAALSQFQSGLRNALGLSAIALGVILVLVALVGVATAVTGRDRPLLTLAVSVAAWWAVMWYGQLATGVDTASDRLVIPALAPSLILMAQGLRRLMPAESRVVGEHHPGRGGSRSLARAACVVVVVAAAALSIVFGVRSAVLAGTHGVEYNSLQVRNGGLFRALSALPDDVVVGSSDPWRGYWASGNPTFSLYDARAVDRIRSGDVVCLALFDGSSSNLSVDSFRAKGLDIRLVATYDDGDLYQRSP